MSYDHCFSTQAADYARFRPRYPKELFEFLALSTPGKGLAWDCGTGNGQVALSLANHFDFVHATDVNPNQIAHAFYHPKVSYRVARAENSELPSDSIDLVTVGNALHWFDLDVFYQEAKRVLKPHGILAVFQYGFQRVEPSIDEILLPFETEFLDEYWTDRNRLAMAGYGRLAFPFERVPAPSLQFSVEWDVTELRGFVSSWSAVQKYKDRNGSDPFAEIEEALLNAWGNPQSKKKIGWNLELHVGKKGAKLFIK